MTEAATTTKLAAALARAQGELRNPVKTHTATVTRSAEKGGGRSHSYDYAKLPDVLDCVRPVLSKHEIAYSQPTYMLDGKLYLRTMLMHAGETLYGDMPLPMGLGPQEMGSQFTYYRKYALGAIVGVAAEDDDDGAAAQDAGNEEAKLRDQLVEKMGESNLGNAQVCAYAKAKGLTKLARDVESLSLDAVGTILGDWAGVVAHAKAANEARPEAKATPAPTPAPESAPAPSGTVDLSGVAPKLAELMQRDKVTKDQLTAFLRKKGAITKAMTCETIAPAMVNNISAQWSEKQLANQCHEFK